MSDAASVRPPRLFPAILFLIAISLVIGGARLLSLGGSPCYVVAGLVLAFSGFRLWLGKPSGSRIMLRFV